MTDERLAEIEARAHAARRLEDDVFSLVAEVRRLREALTEIAQMSPDTAKIHAAVEASAALEEHAE